jgi:hypothetical protein
MIHLHLIFLAEHFAVALTMPEEQPVMRTVLFFSSIAFELLCFTQRIGVKTCSYCGREYADDATVCAIDGEPLVNAAQKGLTERGKVSGTWRGAYGYENKGAFEGKIVPFILTLKQGWLGHFSGTVTEDAPVGMPGVGRVDGFFKWPTIEFTKQMPVGYVTRPNGSRITLREYFIEHGHACDCELASPPISYSGTFLDANRVQGVWIIRPTRISLPDGWGITMSQSASLWCAEFITIDTKAKPTEAPQEPFFDRTLLPEPEVLSEANAAFRSLGKFRVPDAETYLGRFDRENVRYEIGQDDSAIRRMTPFAASMGGYYGTASQVEIFVHPDDEVKAKAIINEGSQI